MTADMSDIPETCPKCGAEFLPTTSTTEGNEDVYACGSFVYGGELVEHAECALTVANRLLAECAATVNQTITDTQAIANHIDDLAGQLAALLAKLREAGVEERNTGATP